MNHPDLLFFHRIITISRYNKSFKLLLPIKALSFPFITTMRMYGDLVNGLCYAAILPVYMGMLWASDPVPGSRNIVIAFAITTSCCWFSYLKHNAIASALAYLGMSAGIVGMNLYRWPFKDEVVVVPQFLWSLLIISGNVQLSFAYKAGMACVAFMTALMVAIYSPLLQVTDVLPLLLGASSVHILFHYFYSCQPEPRILRAHAASLILAGTFAVHTSSEIVTMMTSPGYATQGGYSILKAGFFASVGLVAAGAFHREIDMNEALEILVRERAKKISKQAERLLLVGLALEASETAIAITDPFQKVVWSNVALSKLTGMSESEMHTRILSAVLHSEDVHLCFDDRNSTTVEIMVEQRNIAVEVSPFPDDQDKDACGTRFLVVLKDITEHRARERAEKTAERKADVAKAMSQSMETLTHELRTPLQGVMGITSMLLDDPTLSEDAQESLTVVMTSSRLLLTLINNLLDVRKCDADMLDTFQLGEVSMGFALADAVDFCKPFAKISNVDLEVNLEGAGGVYAESNFLRFQQIMINLISNAIKYTAKGSVVSIGVEVMTLTRAKADIKRAIATGPNQSHWDGRPWNQIKVAVISVSDSGAGIARDGADCLFGKFTQLDSSPTNTLGDQSVSQPSGTGLGLNLCMKFVKRMKGDIWVNNNRDRGCCFSFYLPLVSKDRASIPIPQLTSPKASATPDGNGSLAGSVSTAAGYRVLVVDDTIINLKVLCRMLTRLGVEKVETVDSGSSALEALKKEDYNMVLTDIQMPGMSGTELSDAIHRMPQAEKLVVVAITAEVNESIAARCQNSGIAHVLHKPITSHELKNFFETVAGQLKPIGSKLAVTGDKITSTPAAA
jgi:signal transduction histidine kinase/ActR/RegA family two-component response regulator